MVFRITFLIILFCGLRSPIWGNQIKSLTTPKNPNISDGMNSKFRDLYKAKKQLELSQTLTGDLHRIRNNQNESFSRILQQVYRIERGKMPSKAKIDQLDKFLRQAVKFRTTDNSISTRTLRELIRANKSFDGLDTKPSSLQRLTNEIKVWDKARGETTKIYTKVNSIREKLGYKPLAPYQVKIVRRIVTNDYGFLLEDSIRQKQELTQKLIESGKYKSKAEIRQAVLQNDPAVKEIAQLERRIRFLDRSVKNQPLKKADYQVSKIHQNITGAVKNSSMNQQAISFLNKMPANGNILLALRAQRSELYRSLKAGGDFKDWRDVRAALQDPKVNHPKIVELRRLDLKIQKARFDIKMSKLPPVETSEIFSKKWSSLNQELTRLKILKNYAKGNQNIQSDHMASLKLMQRNLYMEQAAIRLKHSLLVDGTYSSTNAVDSALKSGQFTDPRMKSLARLEGDLSNTRSSITQSTRGKVGYITRLYNQSKANGQIQGSGNLTAKVNEVVKSAGSSVNSKIDGATKIISESGQQVVQKSRELFVKGKDGFNRANTAALETGKTLYVRSGETYEQAKSVLVEKSGKLYEASKSGLTQVKNAVVSKGSQLYQATAEGTVKAVQSTRGRASRLYVQTQEGLVKATHELLNTGSKVYTVGSNGVQQASGALIGKGNDLYVATKEGLARATSSTIQATQKYYQVARNGTTKVVGGLAQTGGHLWIETNQGISKVTQASLAESGKLYRTGRNGLIQATNVIVEKSGKLYSATKNGLTAVKDASLAKGTHIYRASKDGVFRTGKAISAASSELYIKTQDGFQRATSSTLNQGSKVYNLGREGLVNAKNIVIDKAGQLYSSGQNGLTQLKGASAKGAQIYKAAQNGVVSKIHSAGQKMTGLYTMGKSGLVQATQATIAKGADLYSFSKNGIQSVSREALQKTGNLYTITKNGLAKATGQTLQTGSQLYQFGQDGLTQVKTGLVDAGGKLYQSTKDGLVRATQNTIKGASQLYSASKNGSIQLVKSGQTNASRLYTSGKNGLERVTQQSVKAGSKLFTLGKDGALKTSQAFVKAGDQLFQSTKEGLVKVGQNALTKGSQVLQVTRNGVANYATQVGQNIKTANEYVGSRIRMGQLNAGHQWVTNTNTSNSGFLGNNYQPAAPGTSLNKSASGPNSKAPASPQGQSANLLARMNPLNNFSKVKVANTNPPVQPPANGNNQGSPKSSVWDKVRDSAWGKQTSQTGKELAKGIGDLKGKSPSEVIKHVKTVGNQVVDKTLAPDGYEVRRDAIAAKLQTKISQLNSDIAAANANNQPGKAQKLEALKKSLETEYQKSQIGPQGTKLQSEIKALNEQISNLKSSGGNKTDIKALQDMKAQKQQSLNELQGNPANTAKSYVRDGLRFAVISAATQGILNIVNQVQNGDEVNVGNAFEFITSPEFVLGTSGAFAGGLIVQKAMASGVGKIMMHSIMNVIPGGPFVKSVINVLPYTLGAMVGSDLLTGNLGQRGIDEVLVSGIGSSVGMMLGSAIFPPLGSIAGAVLGGMVADSIMKSVGAGDGEEIATRLLYEPKWLEFNELAYSDQDTAELQATMNGDDEEFRAWMKPFLDGLTSVEELERAKADTYQRYTNAVNDEGPDSPNAKNAYRLYQELGQRLEDARASGKLKNDQ